jgi:hypothetical protein
MNMQARNQLKILNDRFDISLTPSAKLGQYQYRKIKDQVDKE